MINLFERVFRYPTNKIQPFENQLTETLAFLCHHSNAFKIGFLSLFVDVSYLVEGDVFINTQSSYSINEGNDYKYIDFEFGVLKEEDLLFTGFIEIKGFAGEHYTEVIEDGNKRSIPQTKAYEKILCKGYFGSKVGLYTLTRSVDPLEIHIDDKNISLFFPTKNITWNDVGSLLEKLIETSQCDVDIFLFKQFLEYLKMGKLMLKKDFTIQDLSCLDQYLSVKEKMWQTLIRSSALLKERVGGEQSSYSTASSQEQKERFCIFKYLDRNSELAVFAGYYFWEGKLPWVGVWLEVNPSKGISDDLRGEIIKELAAETTGHSDDLNIYNKWVSFKKSNDDWWIACHASHLIEFITKENSIKLISDYFFDRTNEILSINSISNIVNKK